MARDGFLILDSDLHMMEPDDLWARYLEGPHRATARSPRRWSSSSGCRSATRFAARSSGTNCARLYNIETPAAASTKDAYA